MIHLTSEDYDRLAMLIEDESYNHRGDFRVTLEYDTSRFNSDLGVMVTSYEDGISNRLCIVTASLKTYTQDGEVINDFDLMKLRHRSYLT